MGFCVLFVLAPQATLKWLEITALSVLTGLILITSLFVSLFFLTLEYAQQLRQGLFPSGPVSTFEGVVTDQRGFRRFTPSLGRYRLAFEDRGVKLHIPINYVVGWWTTEMTKDTPAFHAMATFPDFAGTTNENKDCFGINLLMRCDIVLFAYQNPVRPIEPNLTWYLRDRDLLVPREYGLLGRPGDNLLVHFGEDGWVVQVGCSRLPEWERLPCNMSFSAAGARWRIQFRPALMPRWREIAEGTRSLIDSFAVPETPAPQ